MCSSDLAAVRGGIAGATAQNLNMELGSIYPDAVEEAGGADKLDGWSPELLVGLDWVRLAELARGVAAEGGCELAGSRNFPDSSVMFAMIERPRSTTPQRALVKLAPWNEWGATPETVEHFAQEIATAKNCRGILIAPAGFSTAALHTAQKHRIEAVDATTLCSALSGLRPEKSEIMFAVATTGDYATPTCPICDKRLHRTEQQAPSLPSRTIDVSGLIADPVENPRHPAVEAVGHPLKGLAGIHALGGEPQPHDLLRRAAPVAQVEAHAVREAAAVQVVEGLGA